MEDYSEGEKWYLKKNIVMLYKINKLNSKSMNHISKGSSIKDMMKRRKITFALKITNFVSNALGSTRGSPSTTLQSLTVKAIDYHSMNWNC